MAVKATNKEEKSLYVKSQVINSQRFRDSKDVLEVVLETDKTYSLSEIEKKIAEFRNKDITNQKNGGKK